MDQDHRRTQFAAALIQLCEGRKSVSLVAREIGVNRQQFQKYLSGQTFPSPNMRRRIAQYFGVTPEAFFEPDTLKAAAQQPSPQADLGMTNVPAPEMARLRKYAGIYHVFFVTPAFPDLIHIGVSLLQEQNSVMESTFFVRSRDPKTGQVHRSHLKGSVFLRGERLFLIERSKKAQDRFSQTILLPTHGDRLRYMTGISLGLTWQPESKPYASRTIWRRAQRTLPLRESMRLCGLYPHSSRDIDSTVRNFLTSDADGADPSMLTL